MAIDFDTLNRLSPEQAMAYLRKQLSGGMSSVGNNVPMTSYYADNPVGYVGEGGAWEGGGSDLRNVAVIPAGGDAPAYLAEFDREGNFIGVGRQPENDWYEHEVFGVPIGAFLPVAAAAAASYFPAAGAAEAAGSGITEASLGELGINTALPPGTAGAPFGTSPWINPLAAGPGTGGLPALWQGVKDVAATLGIKDLKTAIQAGLIAAPLLEKAFGGSDSKGTVDPGYTNLVTPFTMTREVNPQAKPLTSQDAYAYLRGQPSPTTGQPVSTKQQNWFTDSFQRQESVNPVSGERFVTDPNTGRMYSSKELEELEKGTVNRAMGGGIAALAAGGGVGHLGGYSDGGQLLRGPGDGVSDSIPATIEGRQPARLADGEFVIPSRIVSELGNGSTEAGAKRLYAMMDRIQKARRGTVGEGQIAKDTNAEKYLPA